MESSLAVRGVWNSSCHAQQNSVTQLTVERVGCDGYPQVLGSEGRTWPTCYIIKGDFKAIKEAMAEKSTKERTI